MSAIKVGSDYRNTLIRATTFGTAMSLSSTQLDLPCKTLDLDQDGDSHELDRAQGVRMMTQSQMFNGWRATSTVPADASEVDMTIPTAKTSPMPLSANLWKTLGPAMFQKSADWAESPTSVLTLFPQTYANLPSFLANEGYFFDLIRRSPSNTDVATERITSCVPTSMKLSIHPKNNNGLLCLESSEWIGKTYARGLDSTATVTAEALAVTYPYFGIDKFAVGVKDSEVSFLSSFYSMEMDLSWGAKFALDVPDKDIVLPEFKVSGNFKVLTLSQAAIDVLRGYFYQKYLDAPLHIQLYWGDGTVTAVGEHCIDLYVYFKGKPEIDRTEGELLTVNFVGVLGSSGQYPFQSAFYHAAA